MTVNLEVDVIAKYVERLLGGRRDETAAKGRVGGRSVRPRVVTTYAGQRGARGRRHRGGRPVVVVDDADRENEGDIIFAASKATAALLAFTIRHTSGVICVPMLGEDLDRLQLPLMTAQNNERMRTAFTVSVDARDGVTTGISAADRARTVRTLGDSATEPYELVRPGHVFPLRYTEGGVLRRPGHTEAAVDLVRLAGLTPAGVLAEVVNDDGTMARLPGLRAFGDEHGLALISIAQLIEYRRHSSGWSAGWWRQAAERVRAVAGDRLPELGGRDRAARAGARRPRATAPDVLVRMHSECLTGDVSAHSAATAAPS